jgi:hypothetical protein
MYTSKQYRAAASKFRERADQAERLADKKEFRSLERSFDTLAENAEWLAENSKNIVLPPQSDDVDAELTAEEEHMLRCLGAALIMQWNTLPIKHQRELFEIAADIGSMVAMPDLLHRRVARFRHKKDGDN